MNGSVHLKGITWDHPRGYAPLVASVEAFRRESGINITWYKRSLKDFGDVSVESLSKEYDLLIIDHPHTGIAADSNCLFPLEQLMNEKELTFFSKQYVGNCYESYRYKNYQWALPIDAACQVSSCRPDLFKHTFPENWKQVFDLSEKIKIKRQCIAIALCSTDCSCSFLTLSAQSGDAPRENKSRLISPAKGVRILNMLHALKEVAHPDSMKWNPVDVYEYMISNDDVIYCPLAFGYVNYAYAGRNKFLKFGTIPGTTGSLLGGAAIAVSSYTNNVEAAMKYIKWICHPSYQSSDYFINQGQPCALSAWNDKSVNSPAGNFFMNTKNVIDAAYTRPRMKEWPAFQEYMGNLIHDFLVKNTDAEMIIKEMNDTYKKIFFEYTN
jgi:multiple sugar transport system substrate-binding protein